SPPARLAFLTADTVPVEAGGWSAAPVVLVDADEAPLLGADAVSALRDHVLAGATLIIAGARDAGLPAAMRAGTPTSVGRATLTGEGASAVEVPALSFESLPG